MDFAAWCGRAVCDGMVSFSKNFGFLSLLGRAEFYYTPVISRIFFGVDMLTFFVSSSAYRKIKNHFLRNFCFVAFSDFAYCATLKQC